MPYGVVLQPADLALPHISMRPAGYTINSLYAFTTHDITTNITFGGSQFIAAHCSGHFVRRHYIMNIGGIVIVRRRHVEIVTYCVGEEPWATITLPFIIIVPIDRVDLDTFPPPRYTWNARIPLVEDHMRHILEQARVVSRSVARRATKKMAGLFEGLREEQRTDATMIISAGIPFTLETRIIEITDARTGETLSIGDEDVALFGGGRMEQGDSDDGTLVEA